MKDILLLIYKHQLKKLGEVSHENMISSHVKILCYLHM